MSITHGVIRTQNTKVVEADISKLVPNAFQHMPAPPH